MFETPLDISIPVLADSHNDMWWKRKSRIGNRAKSKEVVLEAESTESKNHLHTYNYLLTPGSGNARKDLEGLEQQCQIRESPRSGEQVE